MIEYQLIEFGYVSIINIHSVYWPYEYFLLHTYIHTYIHVVLACMSYCITHVMSMSYQYHPYAYHHIISYQYHIMSLIPIYLLSSLT
jgi:hypothetical protein